MQLEVQSTWCEIFLPKTLNLNLIKALDLSRNSWEIEGIEEYIKRYNRDKISQIQNEKNSTNDPDSFSKIFQGKKGGGGNLQIKRYLRDVSTNIIYGPSYKTRLNTPLSYNPAIIFLCIYPKDLETGLCKNLHTDIYSSFIHNCQNLEAIKMSFSKWMDK